MASVGQWLTSESDKHPLLSVYQMYFSIYSQFQNGSPHWLIVLHNGKWRDITHKGNRHVVSYDEAYTIDNATLVCSGVVHLL